MITCAALIGRGLLFQAARAVVSDFGVISWVSQNGASSEIN
jgi:hypothetical protein